jgi:ligand-binding SRPBCC domain-containing protein
VSEREGERGRVRESSRGRPVTNRSIKIFGYVVGECVAAWVGFMWSRKRERAREREKFIDNQQETPISDIDFRHTHACTHTGIHGINLYPEP